MHRFVLLRHDQPFEHFDLMFEPDRSPGAGGDDARELLTFRLPPEWPAAGAVVEATPLPPHRRAYLTYEGPTRSGRGSVTRLAWGEYAITHRADPLRVELRGQRLAPTGGQTEPFAVRIAFPPVVTDRGERPRREDGPDVTDGFERAWFLLARAGEPVRLRFEAATGSHANDRGDADH